LALGIFDFLNNFFGFDTVGVGLGSGLVLVTLFLEDKDDIEALVGSDFILSLLF
jgi:hypothetical protein